MALSGCFGLMNPILGDRNASPEITIVSEDVVVSEGEPATIEVLVDHERSPRWITEGFVTFGVQDIATFERQEDNRWTATIDWQMFNEPAPLTFTGTPSREIELTFRARREQEATATLEVLLRCPTGAACGGSCVDLTSDEQNCGQCGNVCQTECLEARCQLCLPTTGLPDGTTIDELCELNGRGLCQATTFAGTPDVVVAVYRDERCVSTPNPIVQGDQGFVFCDEPLTWTDGLWLRPMCEN
jgi:hypothetical protein